MHLMQMYHFSSIALGGRGGLSVLFKDLFSYIRLVALVSNPSQHTIARTSYFYFRHIYTFVLF